MTLLLRDRNLYRTYFNSHAHVERDAFTFINYYTALNFNSHAHVERDVMLIRKMVKIQISTHTLTWSVTLLFLVLVGTL